MTEDDSKAATQFSSQLASSFEAMKSEHALQSSTGTSQAPADETPANRTTPLSITEILDAQTAGTSPAPSTTPLITPSTPPPSMGPSSKKLVPRWHEVKAGDDLNSIAAEQLGDTSLARLLFEINDEAIIFALATENQKRVQAQLAEQAAGAKAPKGSIAGGDNLPTEAKMWNDLLAKVQSRDEQRKNQQSALPSGLSPAAAAAWTQKNRDFSFSDGSINANQFMLHDGEIVLAKAERTQKENSTEETAAADTTAIISLTADQSNSTDTTGPRSFDLPIGVVLRLPTMAEISSFKEARFTNKS